MSCLVRQFRFTPLEPTIRVIVIISLVCPILTQSHQRIWSTDETSLVSEQSLFKSVVSDIRQPDFEDKYKYSPADAYKLDICGLANLNRWQTEQRAYRCPYSDSARQSRRNQNDAQSRIVDGSLANEGQFPFHVKLVIQSSTETINGLPKKIRCGGTLIHDDLVLTVAQCVINKNKINASLGTNDANSTRPGAIQRVASKWCYFNGEGWSQGLDLAIVRLNEPVKYEQNKIGPACLLLGTGWKPRQPTICSAIGMGYFNEKNETSDYLMTLPVRRRCFDYRNFPRDQYAHCYVADEIGTACAGDNGSPVVCYDKCGNNITRVFAVGAISHFQLGHECRPGQELTPLRVAEFHEVVYNLTLAVRSPNSLGQDELGGLGTCSYPSDT